MQDTRPTVDGDFQVFVEARWPVLVRSLVLLGCPTALAPEVATTGLRHCHRGWPETVEYDDPDVVVHRAVVAAWEERLRGTWWTDLAEDPQVPDTPDAADLAALDRLTPEVRAGVVLRRFAALDEVQAAAVVGPEAGEPLPDLPDTASLRAAGESVPLFALPVADDLTAARPERRRRWLAVTAVVVVALALAGGTWWADHAAEDAGEDGVGLDPVEAKRSPNPAEVAWYAEDILHLAHATYVLPTLRDLFVLGAGAAYGDAEGRVVHLADDGTRTLLGTKDPVAPMAASDPLGWVTWVDPAGTNPRLLVYDLGQADIIAELDLPASRSGPQDEPDTHPVAIDQQTVYFVTSEGARAWRPTRDPGFIETIEPSGLYDVASAVRLSQIGTDVIEIDRPFVVRPVTVPGRGGELSEDGQHALTHDPVDGALRVFDTRTGRPVDVEPPDQLHAVDATLAPEGAITYLTIDPDGFASQEGVNDSNPIKGELVTCRLADGSCESLATVVLDSEAPILAR